MTQHNPTRTCILVAGMHRSGTSATTRVVNLLGADITRKLAPAQAGINDLGYWESSAIFPIHDDLLSGLGSNWDDPFPLIDHWVATDVARRAKCRIVEEIEEDFADSSLFVVKDPRLTRLLPLWLDILGERQIEVVVVIPFRNPMDVALSLQKRDRLSVGKSMLLYVQGYLEIELASRGLRRIFVHYDRLLVDWREFAVALKRVAAPHIPVPTPEAIADIDGFLTTDLHRNKSSRDKLASDTHIAATVVEIFDRLVEVAGNGDDVALQRAFDRMRATVEEATRLYKEFMIAELALARGDAARLLSIAIS